MSVEVQYTHKAVKALEKLEIAQSRRIVKKIALHITRKDFLATAKKLKPPFEDLCRFRIGDYRAVFCKDSRGTVTILTILEIKHRKDVY